MTIEWPEKGLGQHYRELPLELSSLLLFLTLYMIHKLGFLISSQS